jgi:cytoskeletal protein RodZ
MPESQNNTERAPFVCSLWLHIGYVGAVALAAGLLQLLDGESPWLPALALVFFGGMLAAASWHRALITVEQTEPTSAVASDAPSESASRASSKQIGAVALLSPIPLQWTRRRNDDLRHPTLE